MSHLLVSISHGLSLVGAVIVALASVMLGASAIDRVISGFEAASSSDGLSRVLGPMIILIGLVGGALAIVGFGASWRTTRGRGRTPSTALGGGALVAIGAVVLYENASRVAQVLPAHVLATATIGFGVASGGWVLATAIGLFRSRPPTFAGVIGTAVAAAAVSLPVVLGVLVGRSAAEDAELSLGRAELAEIRRQADEFWDNPFHRMTHVEVAVTGRGETREGQAFYRVEAFTFFGLRTDWHVVYDDVAPSQ